MLTQPTFDKLNHLKLYGMANAFRTQLEISDAQQLSFEERFALLVDEQFTWRENRALEHRLRNAKLKQKATMEDINFQHPRGLDRKLLRSLASSEWIREKQNVLLLGPTGIGKSWIGCALAQKACRDGFTALNKKTSELSSSIARAMSLSFLPTALANSVSVAETAPRPRSACKQSHMIFRSKL